MSDIKRASLDQLKAIKGSTKPHEVRAKAKTVDLPDNFWDDAKVVIPSEKKPVSIRVDTDILDFFKEGGRGYQTRINSVLRSYVDAQKRRG